ncbi:MAG: DUF4040 domain-containing protein [Candidatus Bipolaricaulis sp.]|nr:DUF4040 domain-containing protein [Candidatus Bipolaricaulis sp.]MDD5646034.1 DUF4040 domain-containing protein [Candidatus Bipolaricaulis sp.]
MNGVTVLLALLPIVAAFALFHHRRLLAVLGMSVFSLLLAAVFLLAGAPDVAITEAAIGAALSTFVYILAIRRTGRLVVAACDVPGLVHEDHGVVAGLEVDLLKLLARSAGLELVVQLMPPEEVVASVRRGDADVGAGGLLAGEERPGVAAGPVHLPTARFAVRRRDGGDCSTPVRPFRGEMANLIESARRGEAVAVELDLARLLVLTRTCNVEFDITREQDDSGYVFVVAQRRRDLLQRLTTELDVLRRSGELEYWIRRHLT